MKFKLGVIAAALCLSMTGAASAKTLQFKAPLAGADGAAKGEVTATLDSATKAFNYTATYSGLSGPALAAHFHAAEAGANGPPVLPAKEVASPIKGTATLTDAQVADLTAGKWYFNIHTAANPGGEVRAQLPAAK
jgi:hypothetical protein